MKKLLSILGAAGLVVSTSAVLVSCGTKEEDKDTTKEIAIETGKAKFASKVTAASVKFLGVPVLAEKLADEPAPIEYIDGIKADVTLDEEGVNLVGKLIIPADLAAGSYKAVFEAMPAPTDTRDEAEAIQATFDFVVEAAKPELTTIITEKAIGELADNKDATIIAAIIKVNATAADAKLTVVKDSITDTAATVESVEFDGQVEVTFTLKAGNPGKEKLDTIITKKAIGELADNKDATIIAAIIKVNATAADAKLTVVKDSITDTAATVESVEFDGQVEVTFTLKAGENPMQAAFFYQA